MSNFVLLGYGRMGKRIQEIAEERGHRIVLATSHTPVSIPGKGFFIISSTYVFHLIIFFSKI